jgi:hypothetical protein
LVDLSLLARPQGETFLQLRYFHNASHVPNQRVPILGPDKPSSIFPDLSPKIEPRGGPKSAVT